MKTGIKRVKIITTLFYLSLLAMCTFIVYGCASTGFLMAKPDVISFMPPYPPKNANDRIDIFQTKPPEKKYKEIALIKCGDTDDDWNMKQILLKAREIGADGIILVGRTGSYSFTPISGVTSGISFFAFGLGVSEGYGLSAIAIKYIEE